MPPAVRVTAVADGVDRQTDSLAALSVVVCGRAAMSWCDGGGKYQCA